MKTGCLIMLMGWFVHLNAQSDFPYGIVKIIDKCSDANCGKTQTGSFTIVNEYKIAVKVTVMYMVNMQGQDPQMFHSDLVLAPHASSDLNNLRQGNVTIRIFMPKSPSEPRIWKIDADVVETHTIEVCKTTSITLQ